MHWCCAQQSSGHDADQLHRSFNYGLAAECVARMGGGVPSSDFKEIKT